MTAELFTNMTDESAKMIVNSYAAQQRTRFVSEYFESSDAKREGAWESYGWPNQLTATDYYSTYSRQGVAKAGCDVPVDTCWKNNPMVSTDEEAEPTQWDAVFNKLAKRVKLFNRLVGLDRRQRVGRYAGMVMFVADGKTLDQPLIGNYGPEKLAGLRPYFETQLVANEWDQDPKSIRYGEPTTYQIQENTLGDKGSQAVSRNQTVHWTRVIVWAEGSDDGSIYGTPALEAPFNALLTLELLQGSGGEAFFKNAKNTPSINFDEKLNVETVMAYLGVDKPQDIPEALSSAVNDYNTRYDSPLAVQGATFNQMPVTLPNPKEFYDMTLDIVAAGFQIPRNILIGSQVGVLAGDKDSAQFAQNMQSRRETYINPNLEATIDRFVEIGFLPEYDELFITWEPLIADTDTDKLDRAEKMAKVNKDLASIQMEPAFTVNEVREAGGYSADEELNLPEDTGGETDEIDEMPGDE